MNICSVSCSYHNSKPFSAVMKWNPSIALGQTKRPSIPQVVPAWCLVTATEHSQCIWWHETKGSLESSLPSATKTWLIQTHMNPWTWSCQSCLWWTSNMNSRTTVEMPGGHVKPLQAPLLSRVRNQQVAWTRSVSQGICNNLERPKTGMKTRPLHSAVWVTGYTVWVSVLSSPRIYRKWFISTAISLKSLLALGLSVSSREDHILLGSVFPG